MVRSYQCFRGTRRLLLQDRQPQSSCVCLRYSVSLVLFSLKHAGRRLVAFYQSPRRHLPAESSAQCLLCKQPPSRGDTQTTRHDNKPNNNKLRQILIFLLCPKDGGGGDVMEECHLQLSLSLSFAVSAQRFPITRLPVYRPLSWLQAVHSQKSVNTFSLLPHFSAALFSRALINSSNGAGYLLQTDIKRPVGFTVQGTLLRRCGGCVRGGGGRCTHRFLFLY